MLRVALLIIAFQFAFISVGFLGKASWAGKPIGKVSRSNGFFDFSSCVRYAISNSDEFLKNRINIQIASADLKDAHTEILPTLELTSRYYFHRAEKDNNPINVQLSISNWNPYQALLEIKSRSILVDIARLAHFEKMASGVELLAKTFYRINLIEKKIKGIKQRAALVRGKVQYGQSKKQRGSIDPLKIQMWSAGLREELLLSKELNNLLLQNKMILKTLMGYYPDYRLNLDTRDAASQILAGFNGSHLTFNHIQSNNFQLMIAAKKEQLQSNSVSGAYVALLPKPLLILEGLNNEPDRTSGTNVALGLHYNIWDGLRGVREVSKQKLKARKAYLDRKLLSRNLYNEFIKVKSQLDIAVEREAVYREKVGLASLNEEKALNLFKIGEITFEEYTDIRMQRVSVAISSIEAAENKIMALIELATLAGGLNRYNARIKY